MLKMLRKTGKYTAIFECYYCHNEYETNMYDAQRSNLGHICKDCKNIDPNNLTQEKLKTLIHYDPATGEITANMPRHNVPTGTSLGCICNPGYYRLSIAGKHFLAHRLAWFYMTGNFPEQIDHINHIKTDNRWENLREVSNQANSQNTPLSKNSRTKINGVSFMKTLNKYRAYITVNRKHIHLGVFDKLEDAIQARKDANVKYGFHSNHGK